MRLRTCTQYASMNEFTCSEHSVRIRTRKKKNASLENSLYLECARVDAVLWCKLARCCKTFEKLKILR